MDKPIIFNLVILLGLLLGSGKVYFSFQNFLDHVHLLGTDNEWKFYFSLVSLLLFSGLLLSLVMVLIIRMAMIRFRKI